jgi:hypothetical protein
VLCEIFIKLHCKNIKRGNTGCVKKEGGFFGVSFNLEKGSDGLDICWLSYAFVGFYAKCICSPKPYL